MCVPGFQKRVLHVLLDIKQMIASWGDKINANGDNDMQVEQIDDLLQLAEKNKELANIEARSLLVSFHLINCVGIIPSMY